MGTSRTKRTAGIIINGYDSWALTSASRIPSSESREIYTGQGINSDGTNVPKIYRREVFLPEEGLRRGWLSKGHLGVTGACIYVSVRAVYVFHSSCPLFVMDCPLGERAEVVHSNVNVVHQTSLIDLWVSLGRGSTILRRIDNLI